MREKGIFSEILYFKGVLRCTMSAIIPMRDIEQKRTLLQAKVLHVNLSKKGFEFAYKPSSVVYGHLSRLAVADKLKRYSR